MDTFPPEIMMFRGQYEFLSNFYVYPLHYDGEEWMSSEHAYQAAKTLVKSEWDMIKVAPTPGAAKKLGKPPELGGIVTLRPGWTSNRINVMFDILEAKFSNPELAEKLLSTGNIKLIEGNTWGDTFWGVDIRKRTGQNMLGKLLMQIREDKLNFS